MHPHTFYSTLFGNEKRDEVFVVMSFAPEFDARWKDVIRPTIETDLNFKANRVDFNSSGESVVHDILDGIAHARLIVADITSSNMKDVFGRTWPQRNGNVMWEVGIAHTMRLPDEVVLIRSDDDPSIFDLTQFRAFPYEPSDVEAAKHTLRQLCVDRLKSVELSKSDYVRRCADSLDPYAAAYLILQVPLDGAAFNVEPAALGGAPSILFELGILKAKTQKLIPVEPNKVTVHSDCVVTTLGRSVAEFLANRMGISTNSYLSRVNVLGGTVA